MVTVILMVVDHLVRRGILSALSERATSSGPSISPLAHSAELLDPLSVQGINFGVYLFFPPNVWKCTRQNRQNLQNLSGTVARRGVIRGPDGYPPGNQGSAVFAYLSHYFHINFKSYLFLYSKLTLFESNVTDCILVPQAK